MKNKYYATAREAVDAFVKSGDTIALAGVSNSCVAKELSFALEEKFLETGEPKNLTVLSMSAPLDGMDMYAHEGMTSRVIVGHYNNNSKLKEFVADGKCASYNLPQGIMSILYRSASAGEKGLLTKVGLGTFVDPRQQGGKMNGVTEEDVVDFVEFQGEEYLWYHTFAPDIAFIRGTVADEKGNVSLEDEMYWADAQYVARAAKASGGKVIVQVRDYVKAGSLPAHKVQIPGILVDAVVTTKDVEKFHRMTPGTAFSKYLLGEAKMPASMIQSKPKPLDERKVIGRRAAMEVGPDMNVNIGFGMPEVASSVMTEEGVAEHISLSVEHGLVGGVAAPGERFAVHVNYDALVDAPCQFDFYHAGGLDITLLGNAQTSPEGNVNVHKFGRLPTGVGGFIDIVTATKKIVFCGTLTTKELKEHVEDGKLVIDQEGKVKKFVAKLPEITFNAAYGLQNGCKVVYVTERAVFELTERGIMLTEYAPGIDLQRDVLDQMDFKPILSEHLKEIDARIFRPEKMGLVDDFLQAE
ncbi:MAG TPA: CoA-transferase [Oscillospiraceae bacterium]|nr:CoA-transferase [Oscillospiraceae bacterium]